MQLSRHWRDVHEAARGALAVGDGDGCRDWAMRMMRRARQAGDIEAQAHAALLLARSQWVSAMPAGAMNWSGSAERLARRAGDSATAASALSVQSCAASAMGRPDVAMACARNSLKESGVPVRDEAVAVHYLAAAYFWGGRFGEAQATFALSLDMAAECPDRVLSFQPLVNRCLSALLELGAGGLWRHRLRSEPLEAGLERLHLDLEACDRLLRHGQISTVNLGMERMVELCFHCLRGQLMLLHRQLEAADGCLQKCRDLSQAFPRRHWVRLFVHWLEFEYAHRQGDTRCAMVSAQAMELAAARGGHEAFRVFAQGLCVTGSTSAG